MAWVHADFCAEREAYVDATWESYKKERKRKKGTPCTEQIAVDFAGLLNPAGLGSEFHRVS